MERYPNTTKHMSIITYAVLYYSKICLALHPWNMYCERRSYFYVTAPLIFYDLPSFERTEIL